MYLGFDTIIAGINLYVASGVSSSQLFYFVQELARELNISALQFQRLTKAQLYKLKMQLGKLYDLYLKLMIDLQHNKFLNTKKRNKQTHKVKRKTKMFKAAKKYASLVKILIKKTKPLSVKKAKILVAKNVSYLSSKSLKTAKGKDISKSNAKLRDKFAIKSALKEMGKKEYQKSTHKSC